MAEQLRSGTHELDVNGLVQRYHVFGDGPVCVAYPAGPGVFWEYLRMPALERHLTMVYIEPLGTGASGRLPTHPHGYTRELHGDAIDQILDHLGQPKVHLLGHSHGGFVVQRYAADHADRLSGLILYASAPVTGPEMNAETRRKLDEFAKRNAGNPELPAVLRAADAIAKATSDDQKTASLRALLPAYLADYWGRRDDFTPLRDAIKVTYVSRSYGDGTPETVADREILPWITTPTLVLVGRYDFVTGVRWAREIHDLVLSSQLTIFEESGHFIHVEETDAFADAVYTFVKATDGSR